MAGIPRLFRGPYRIVNESRIRERARNEGDPRHPFYQAMLACTSYEEYYSKVGGIKVKPSTTTYKSNAHMEMRYARDAKWVEDLHIIQEQSK